jgi:hypothetical protein
LSIGEASGRKKRRLPRLSLRAHPIVGAVIVGAVTGGGCTGTSGCSTAWVVAVSRVNAPALAAFRKAVVNVDAFGIVPRAWNILSDDIWDHGVTRGAHWNQRTSCT